MTAAGRPKGMLLRIYRLFIASLWRTRRVYTRLSRRARRRLEDSLFVPSDRPMPLG
jgi:hypothetical protein